MKIKKFFSALVVLAIVCCGSLPAFAAVPERPANRYVLDSANVLSDETEKKIISQNEKLFQATGAEIVIVSVDFIDGNDSADYTYDIFEAWGIGSKQRNNGLILMFAVGENKLWAMPGYGIEDLFTASLLTTMLQDTFDDAYDNRQYDEGVNAFFDDAYRRMENYYQNYTDEYTVQSTAYTNGGGPTTRDRGTGGVSGGFGGLTRGILAIVVIVVVISVLGSFGRRGGGGYGGYGGGGGGFWSGMFLGSMFGGRRHHHHHRRPPPGGFGGFGGGGGFGGFGGGGGSGGGGAGRGGGFGGGGGFSGGGGSRGGGAGRR